MDAASVKKELFEIMQDGKEHEIFDLVTYFKNEHDVDRAQVTNAISHLLSKGGISRVARGVYIITDRESRSKKRSILDTLNDTFDKMRMQIECTRVNAIEYVSDKLSDEERSEIDRKILFMKKIYIEICNELAMETEDIQFMSKYSCATCGYEYTGVHDLDFDERERVPCCPVCKTLIESEYE